MKNYAKIFKWMMLALIVISFALLVIGFASGFEANDGAWTDVLLYWAYVMIVITLVATVIVGLWISIKNNPKLNVKFFIGVAAFVVVGTVAYLLAEDKFTDTILNLTYLVGALAIIAIIVGEVRLTMVNKKK